ncbi:MAG TPA: paraquat-inducible protein A [Planctomycetota bacterium]|nr:paraquat-inducible protein A [Planctomycetota bacterium]
MNAGPSRVIRRRPLIGGLLGLSLILNIAALCLPFVMVDAAGSDPYIYGLIGSVQMLLDSGMIALAVLVVAFSIVFPFAKLGMLSWLWWVGVQTPYQVVWLE